MLVLYHFQTSDLQLRLKQELAGVLRLQTFWFLQPTIVSFHSHRHCLKSAVVKYNRNR